MSKDRQKIELLRGLIRELPPAQREAAEEMAQHLRAMLRVAGDPVGTMALALVVAEVTAEDNERNPDETTNPSQDG